MKTITLLLSLVLFASTTARADNPIITDVFTADPAAASDEASASTTSTTTTTAR